MATYSRRTQGRAKATTASASRHLGRIPGVEADGEEEHPEHEQPRGGLQAAQQRAAGLVERRQHPEEEDPRQTRHSGRAGDQHHAPGDEHDLECHDRIQRLHLVEDPVRRA